ncbi:MAG: hypothetical protein QM770_00890 [Tepidisphaeraceae bacterium]
MTKHYLIRAAALAVAVALPLSFARADAPAAPAPNTPTAPPAGALVAAADAPVEVASPLDALTPLVRATSVGFVYIDPAKVDMPAVGEWMTQTIKTLPNISDEDKQKFIAEMTADLPKAQAKLKEAREVGLQALYFVMEMPSPTNGGDPIVAMKLADGADAKKIRDIFEIPTTGGEPVEVAGLTLLGSQAQLDKLKAGTPAKRAEVAKAFAIAGDAPVQVVIAPPPGALNILPMTMPKLPAEYGGTDTKQLVDGVQAFIIAGNTPPTPQGSLRILATKPEQLIAALKQTKEATIATMKGNTGAQTGNLTNIARALLPVLENLPEPVAGEGLVTFAFDEARVRAVADGLAPAIFGARSTALDVKTSSNARQLLVGVMLYANEHKGEFPTALDDLAPYLNGAEMLAKVNKIEKSDEKFVYRKPSVAKMSELKNPSSVVLLHQPTDGHKADDRIVVGFADGHVEMMTLSEMQARLKDGKIKLADEGASL